MGFARSRRLATLLLCLGSPAAVADERDGTAGGARAARAALLEPSSATMSREELMLGRIDADHEDGYLYRLPYGNGVSFPIIQGYGAKPSHSGAERFTVDFGMPIGTPVHAARNGVVVRVEDSHAAGCSREECGWLANFVVVLHSDGTTGEYFHLQRASVRVRVGEQVGSGQWLARSGNTGFSTVPHLHFGVYRTGRDSRTESLAVRFQARGGPVSVPRSGAHYRNLLE